MYSFLHVSLLWIICTISFKYLTYDRWTWFATSNSLFMSVYTDLSSACVHFSHDDKLDSEGMQVLIEFSLVRGNLGGIFKVLKLLYGMQKIFFCAWLLSELLIQGKYNTIFPNNGSFGFVSDNMHLKFTARKIVDSLIVEQEKAIQRHGKYCTCNICFRKCSEKM